MESKTTLTTKNLVAKSKLTFTTLFVLNVFFVLAFSLSGYSQTQIANRLLKPNVSTDKLDYAPGGTVIIKASGFNLNSTIKFHIADDPNDPGDDGEADIYKPFSIKDGLVYHFDSFAYEKNNTFWIVRSNNNGTKQDMTAAYHTTLNLITKSYDTDEKVY